MRSDRLRRRSAIPPVAAAMLTLTALAGCEIAGPADQLWPNTAYQPGQPWQATPAATAPSWWEDRIAIAAGTVDDRPATVISNRADDQAITVHYRDGSGALQSIAIPAGGSVGVASPPMHVVAID